MVSFDPTVGDEIQKSRPALVISEDGIGRIGLRIVVPITSWYPAYAAYPWLVKLSPSQKNGLRKESAADAAQVKSVSLKRFDRKLGAIASSELREIVAAVALCIGYESADGETPAT